MDTPAQFQSQIISNARISEGFYELSLSWDAHAPVPTPGRFLTLRIGSGAAPLLRRPFAFAGFDAATSIATVIYQKRGAGTERLAAARTGDGLDVIGPLGRPFVVDTGINGISNNHGINNNDYGRGINANNDHGIINNYHGIHNNVQDCGINNNSTNISTRKYVIVAGGVGLGPMLFLASSLQARNVPAQFIFGCRSQAFIPSIKIFTDANPQICTDDGSVGYQGTVADYINTNVSSGIDTDTTVCACGPLPMLRAVNRIAQDRGARCLVSLEAVMACGVGACVGCAVPTESGYKRVCKEGPVFDGGEVLWERM